MFQESRSVKVQDVKMFRGFLEVTVIIRVNFSYFALCLQRLKEDGNNDYV